MSRVEEKSREKLNTSMAIHKDEKKLLISERDSLNKDLFQSKYVSHTQMGVELSELPIGIKLLLLNSNCKSLKVNLSHVVMN